MVSTNHGPSKSSKLLVTFKSSWSELLQDPFESFFFSCEALGIMFVQHVWNTVFGVNLKLSELGVDEIGTISTMSQSALTEGGSRDTPNYQSYWSFLMLNFISPVFYGRFSLCVLYFEGDSALWVKFVFCVGRVAQLRIGLKKLCFRGPITTPIAAPTDSPQSSLVGACRVDRTGIGTHGPVPKALLGLNFVHYPLVI